MGGDIPGRGGPTWEGLLKWSIANSDGLPPREVSEEDAKWMNEAMQANTVDVVRRMKEISVVLNLPQQMLDEQDVTTEELEGMLEELQEYVESIDMANDLHAIGGLLPLLGYLKNPHASIRARAAEVVSTIVQNNPKSQQQVMDVKGLQLLLQNFSSDEDLNVRAKALGAISSLIRHNKAGVAAFRLANGYAGLRDALSSDHLRLERKALQVLSYLLQENPKDAKVVSDLGLQKALVRLVSNPDGDIRQASLTTLVEMTRYDAADSGSQLRQVLGQRIDEITQYAPEDQAAAREECTLINILWQHYFHEPSALRHSVLLVPTADAPQGDATPILESAENGSQSVQKSDKPPLMLAGPR